MKKLFGRRPLSFEQMEPRLALSAATFVPTDFVLKIERVDVDSGGYLATGRASMVAAAPFFYDSSTLSNDSSASLIIIDGDDFLFFGSESNSAAANEQDDLGSLVTPIPQPQLGNEKLGDGLISVGEIFHPSQQMQIAPSEQHVVQNKAIETVTQESVDESWRSISLNRGRDIYFEVGELSTERKPSERTVPKLKNEIVPVAYERALLNREAVKPSANDAADNRESVPTDPQARSEGQQQSTSDANRAELTKETAVEKSERTAHDSDAPVADRYSRADDAADHVFAALGESDELGDEAIALRNESSREHSAAWPVLAALAATGWMARTRRSSGTGTHRLPRRRRKF